MAVAKLVCSECGGVLSGGESSCPHCGAVLEQAKGAAQRSRRCDVCGHENSGVGAYCESCGARLSFSPQPKSPVQQAQVPKPTRPEKKKPVPKTGSRFEWWHIAAGISILVFAGIFIYTEITRPKPESHTHENVSPDAAAVMKEIDKLQSAIDANPNDAAAVLRLANMLHDFSLQDPRLLNRAVQAYQRYLQIDPANPDARVDLGIVYFELARVDSLNARQYFGKAINEMEAVAKAHPTHQPAAFNLGIVNLHAENTEESNRWFKRAVDISPTSDLGTRAKRMLEGHSFPSQTN